MLAAMTVGSGLAGLFLAVNGGVGQRRIIHNPMRVHLLPQRMILPRCVIGRSCTELPKFQCHMYVMKDKQNIP